MTTCYYTPPADRKKIRAAWVELIQKQDPNTFITLATNQNITVDRMKDLTKTFFGHLDRRLLGTKYSKKTTDKRTNGFAFIEHESSNIHVHCLIRPANKLHTPSKIKITNSDLEAIWLKVYASGSFDYQPITELYNLSRYVTKEFKTNNYDTTKHTMILEDFCSNK